MAHQLLDSTGADPGLQPLRTADLTNWLYNLKLPLGNISQEVAGSKIGLYHVICTQFVVSGVESAFKPDVQVTVDVANLNLFCFGDFDISTHIPIIGNIYSRGTVNVTAHTDVNIAVTITQNFSSIEPANANSTCKVGSKVDTIAFHGHGVQAIIIEILQPIVKALLPSILDPKICGTINTLVQKNFTALMDKIDGFLELPIPPPLPAPEFPPTILPLGIVEGLSEYLQTTLGPNGSLSIPKIVAGLTNGTGVLDMKSGLILGPLELMGVNATVKINELKVKGLNSTQVVEVIKPQDKFFLDTVFSIRNLDILANLTVTVSLKGFEPLTQTFTVAASAKNTAFGAKVLLGLDTLTFLNSTLYQLSQLSCYTDVIYAFNVSSFNATLKLTSLSVNASGILESELAELFNSVVDFVLYNDGSLVANAVDRFANSKLRTVVNAVLNGFLESQRILCSRYPPSPVFDWMDFGPVLLLSQINDEYLNHFLNTIAPSGSIQLPLNRSLSFTALGVTLGLVVNEVDITGIKNTFYNTTVLTPLSHTDIASSLGLGQNYPLDIYLDFHFSLNGATPMTHLLVNETISRLHFSIIQDVKLNNKFLDVTLLEILEGVDLSSQPMLNEISRKAECFVANYVENWNFTVTQLELRDERTEVFFNGEWFYLKDLLMDVSPSLYNLVETLSGELVPTLDETVNKKISTLRHDAPYYCAGKIPPPENSGAKSTIPNWALALIILGTTWFVVMIIACGGWRAYARRKKQEALYQDISLDETKHAEQLTVTQTVDYLPWTSLRAYYPVEDKYGLTIQILVPLLILATTTIKIWALVAKVTRVRMKVDLPSGDNLIDDYIIDFTFSNMVEYFWKSEAYLISILIVCGSCVLPLILELTLLLVWFVPSKPTYRGRILMLFTQLGKGSYIDIMFLCYIILVMKQQFNLAGTEATITAEPVDGIFGGIASTTMNLILCHLLFYLHNTKLEQKPHPTDQRSSLWQLHARRDLGDQRNGLKSWAQFVTLVLGFLVTSVCLAVVVFKSNVTWFKLTGVLAEIPNTDNHYDIIKQYNLYAFPKDLPENTDELAGAYCIAVVYTVLALMNPLVMLLGWIVLWVVPLKKNIQRTLYATLQRVWSFSGLEVFWIASFAAVLEINKVAVWILNHTLEGWCSGAGNLADFCDLLEPLANTGDFLHVDAKFLAGGYWLLAQCILFYLIYNSTLYYGGMLLGNTSRNGWIQPPKSFAGSQLGTPWKQKTRDWGSPSG